MGKKHIIDKRVGSIDHIRKFYSLQRSSQDTGERYEYKGGKYKYREYGVQNKCQRDREHALTRPQPRLPCPEDDGRTVRGHHGPCRASLL